MLMKIKMGMNVLRKYDERWDESLKKKGENRDEWEMCKMVSIRKISGWSTCLKHGKERGRKRDAILRSSLRLFMVTQRKCKWSKLQDTF